MKRIGIICLALVLSLGVLGVGYAAWTDTLTISGTVTTGDVEWEIQGPIINGDPPTPGSLDLNCFFDLYDGVWVVMDKDVGSTSVNITDPHTMTVTVDNAYPYYGNHIAFKVHGLGSIPLRIWKVNFLVDNTVVKTLYAIGYVYLDLDGNGENDLQLWWGNNFGVQMHYCDKGDMSFELLILQPAPQNEELTFTIELIGIQWDEYTSGP